MGRGFAGQIVELSGLKQSWSCGHSALASSDPFAVLRAMEHALNEGEVIAGWLGYECALALEPGLALPTPPLDVPAAWLGVFAEASPPRRPNPFDRQISPDSVVMGDGRELYQSRVETIRQRITRGDVFQVNYSHRQSAQFPPSDERLIDRLPWQEALRADYGALFDLGDVSVVSASPELFLSLEDRLLAAEPVKGTRPRHADPEIDHQLLQDLIGDQKDRAENIMIADLMRNDLSKVVEDGSMREPIICGARSYEHVHHLYSRIEGQLRAGFVFADALAAAFPCGSVTGAPKLAAMKAIAELEGEGRGPYCGALVYRPYGNKAVASVAIRTAVVDEATRAVHVRSGGGVTILSDPETEYNEAIDKGYLFRHLAGQHDPYHR